jgi:N-acetylglucosamine transport system permease protein
MRQGKYPFIVGFLAAPVILYAVFVIGPYAQAFYIAMTNWRGFAPPRFTGLDNFRRLFDDDVFWTALKHNLVILLVLPLATIAIALFFSFLLNVGGGKSRAGQLTGVWGSKVYKVIFFLPQVLAVAIIAVLFQSVYRPTTKDGYTGMLNGLLEKVGLSPVEWLTNPKLALWSVIAVLVWQAVGFYVVLFSAGMSSIPADLFDAAALDGAGRFTLFFRIMLPLLWDTLQVGWVYLGIAAFDCFAIVQVLTANSSEVDTNTTVLSMETYRNAFRYSQYGYASAMGVALFFLTITFAALALRLTRRRETLEF